MSVSYTHLDVYKRQGKLIDEIFGEFCEGTFIQPTFITDYPVEMSPLTKMHRSKPGPVSYTHLDVYKRQIEAGEHFVQTVVEGSGLLYVGYVFLITVILC